MIEETLTISAIEQNTTVRLSDYKPHPRNYNRHPDSQIQRIAKSLDKFGQVRSIVVWRDYVLAGHGVPLLRIGYRDALRNPQATAGQVADFLGANLDRAAMAQAVAPELHRQRSD